MATSEPDPRLGDARFRLAFDRAPIGMALVGLDYRFQRVNDSLCEALGYSREELLSRSFVDLTHPDDIKRDADLAEKLFRGEIPTYRLEKRFVTSQGRQVWLDVAAFVVRGDANQVPYGLAMVQNITERKETEAALRTSEERYRSFVVNSSEAIWRFEIEQPIAANLPVDEQIEAIYKYAYLAECNDAMARLYGHERAEDIIGAGLNAFISLNNPTNLASLKGFVTNNYRLLNAQSIAPDPMGDERYFSSSVIGIVVNGFLLRVWGTQRDETARHLAEEKLKHSQKQLRSLAGHLQALRERERSNLARELHDELGQSLASLKLDLSRVKKQFERALDFEVRADIQARLSSAFELVEKTIAQVKVISTELRPGVLDKFGLAAAIEWQCREFERRTGIKCEYRLPETDVRLIPARSTALFRIFQEALSNVSRHSHATNVSVTLYTDDSDVTLSVRDSGRGITDEEISAPDSLGLLGMRERTELLGGQFLVEGKPGRTVVNAQIPIDVVDQKPPVSDKESPR